jgi:hypothetical protein
VFENRLLRRIFGPKNVEVMGGWGRLNNEELCDFKSSPSMIRMIRSWRMRWGEEECIYVIGVKARGKETTRTAKT